MIDRQPTLLGEFLELRPLRSDHWAVLFAVASDPLLWAQHPESDRYKQDVFQAFFAEALKSGGALVVIERNTGQVIGSSRYGPFDATKREIEIGWTFLARRYWGGTYNREMKRLMLEHAFKVADQVVFVIGSENRRARRAVEKIGGVLLRDLREANDPEHVVYGLSKAMFERPLNGLPESRCTDGLALSVRPR